MKTKKTKKEACTHYQLIVERQLTKHGELKYLDLFCRSCGRAFLVEVKVKSVH